MREKPKNSVGIYAWLKIIHFTLQEVKKKSFTKFQKKIYFEMSCKRHERISSTDVFAVYDQFHKNNMEM